MVLPVRSAWDWAVPMAFPTNPALGLLGRGARAGVQAELRAGWGGTGCAGRALCPPPLPSSLCQAADLQRPLSPGAGNIQTLGLDPAPLLLPLPMGRRGAGSRRRIGSGSVALPGLRFGTATVSASRERSGAFLPLPAVNPARAAACLPACLHPACAAPACSAPCLHRILPAPHPACAASCLCRNLPVPQPACAASCLRCTCLQCTLPAPHPACSALCLCCNLPALHPACSAPCLRCPRCLPQPQPQAGGWWAPWGCRRAAPLPERVKGPQAAACCCRPGPGPGRLGQAAGSAGRDESGRGSAGAVGAAGAGTGLGGPGGQRVQAAGSLPAWGHVRQPGGDGGGHPMAWPPC